jgi:hypothetical protein
MVCQQAPHLFKVCLQRVFLGALFFKFTLLSQVCYTYYPAYCADHPGYDQGEDLDNILSVGDVLGADIFDQHPPQQTASNYKNDNSKDSPYCHFILKHPTHGHHYAAPGT